jgi:GNAT superfamily N-acetyltransferase
MVERVRRHLGNPDAFALMALYHDDPIAHTMWTPARENNEPDNELIPGLIHLGALFVLEPWWGHGIATTLHGAGVNEMTARGWNEARLYTPAEQHRARRFYEREGWVLREGPYFEPRTGLDMVEYRRPLG